MHERVKEPSIRKPLREKALQICFVRCDKLRNYVQPAKARSTQSKLAHKRANSCVGCKQMGGRVIKVLVGHKWRAMGTGKDASTPVTVSRDTRWKRRPPGSARESAQHGVPQMSQYFTTMDTRRYAYFVGIRCSGGLHNVSCPTF